MRYGGEGLNLYVDTIVTPAFTTSTVIYSRACFLLGYTVIEATGAAPAVIKLFDGVDGNGDFLDQQTVSAGGSVRSNPGQPGMPCEHGIFAQMGVGSVLLSLTVGTWRP